MDVPDSRLNLISGSQKSFSAYEHFVHRYSLLCKRGAGSGLCVVLATEAPLFLFECGGRGRGGGGVCAAYGNLVYMFVTKVVGARMYVRSYSHLANFWAGEHIC